MYLTLWYRNHHIYNEKLLFLLMNIVISVLLIFILYKAYIISILEYLSVNLIMEK